MDTMKIGIVGCGMVGSTSAYALVMSGVDPHHVHAYVLGEHGDSEVPAWSQVTIAGLISRNSPRSPARRCPTRIAR